MVYKGGNCSIDKKKNQLFWTGKIKPTALSKEYTVVLVYYPGKSPKVWVAGDKLEKLDDAKSPARGAWIEILYGMCAQDPVKVAPREGRVD